MPVSFHAQHADDSVAVQFIDLRERAQNGHNNTHENRTET